MYIYICICTQDQELSRALYTAKNFGTSSTLAHMQHSPCHRAEDKARPGRVSHGEMDSLSDEHINWLVVSTPLKNIYQLGLSFSIYGKMKNVPNHQPVNYV